MGHTGVARLCLVRWYYRTRTKPVGEGKPPPLQAGEDVTDKHIPVIVGEYGTMKSADTASRVYFCEMFSKRCFEAGIPCFFWDNGEEYDRLAFQWRTPGLIEALQHAVSGEDYEVTKS